MGVYTLERKRAHQADRKGLGSTCLKYIWQPPGNPISPQLACILGLVYKFRGEIKKTKRASLWQRKGTWIRSTSIWETHRGRGNEKGMKSLHSQSWLTGRRIVEHEKLGLATFFFKTSEIFLRNMPKPGPGFVMQVLQGALPSRG